jgi:hypothetical protein
VTPSTTPRITARSVSEIMLYPVMIEFRQYCGLFSLIRFAAAIAKNVENSGCFVRSLEKFGV